MTEFAEKRDFLRMPIDCALSFSPADDDESYQGKVINLSSKGILFSSEKAVDVGTGLVIVLTPANSITPPMRTRARVARIDARETSYDIACEIEDA